MGVHMFGRPDKNIDSTKISESPFWPFPQVIIAYPSFHDWTTLHNRGGALAAMHRTHQRANEIDQMRFPLANDKFASSRVAWMRQLFRSQRESFELAVRTQLAEIAKRATGKIVLQELKAANRKVRIFPFTFAPPRYWSPTTGAVTVAREALAAWLAKTPLIGGMPGTGTRFSQVVDKDSQPTSTHTPAGQRDKYAEGTGTGSDSDIFYTPKRLTSSTADDELLCHELVHATRYARGVAYNMPVDGGYGNQEEFVAATLENMYRSETQHRPLVHYNHTPIKDTASFLDTSLTPKPRLLLAVMRSEQPVLFTALSQIKIPFNPIAQIEKESRALSAKIER